MKKGRCCNHDPHIPCTLSFQDYKQETLETPNSYTDLLGRLLGSRVYRKELYAFWNLSYVCCQSPEVRRRRRRRGWRCWCWGGGTGRHGSLVILLLLLLSFTPPRLPSFLPSFPHCIYFFLSLSLLLMGVEGFRGSSRCGDDSCSDDGQK